jgi:hypothetical protein
MILEKLEDEQLIENKNKNETVRGQILPLLKTVPNSKSAKKSSPLYLALSTVSTLYARNMSNNNVLTIVKPSPAIGCCQNQLVLLVYLLDCFKSLRKYAVLTGPHFLLLSDVLLRTLCRIG